MKLTDVSAWLYFAAILGFVIVIVSVLLQVVSEYPWHVVMLAGGATVAGFILDWIALCWGRE